MCADGGGPPLSPKLFFTANVAFFLRPRAPCGGPGWALKTRLGAAPTARQSGGFVFFGGLSVLCFEEGGLRVGGAMAVVTAGGSVPVFLF